jgi:hypothetical protein
VVPLKKFEDKKNFDVFGDDLDDRKPMSYDECKSWCGSEPNCKAITYSRAERWCFTKSGAHLLVANEATDAALQVDLKAKIRLSTITIHPKTDLPGSDYYMLNETTFGDCLNACESDPQCKAFSYVRKGQSCFLKKDIPLATHTARVDSGAK